MKIIIHENQLKMLLSELVPQDIDNIRMGGDELIEEYEVGPYTIFLTRHKYMGMHKIGLTTTGTPCTIKDFQFSQVGCVSHREIIDAYPKIVDKISEWVDRYGKMFIASWNEKKVYQYHRIFTRFGLVCGNIRHFMDGYMFQVGNESDDLDYFGF